jgi:hypothetical protein
MILLKRIFRKYGKVCVTGDYDEGEDGSSMAKESKNHPPHAGCLHYTARHADYPEARVIENQIPRAAQSPCDASKVVVDQSAFDAGMRRYRADQRRRKARYVKRKAAGAGARRSTPDVKPAQSDSEWLSQNIRADGLHIIKVGAVKPLPLSAAPLIYTKKPSKCNRDSGDSDVSGSRRKN